MSIHCVIKLVVTIIIITPWWTRLRIARWTNAHAPLLEGNPVSTYLIILSLVPEYSTYWHLYRKILVIIFPIIMIISI